MTFRQLKFGEMVDRRFPFGKIAFRVLNFGQLGGYLRFVIITSIEPLDNTRICKPALKYQRIREVKKGYEERIQDINFWAGMTQSSVTSGFQFFPLTGHLGRHYYLSLIHI